MPDAVALAWPPVQASVPPVPVPALTTTVTVAVPVAAFPNGSTIRTDGCVAQAVPPVPPDGWATKTRAEAGAAVTANAPAVALARPGAEAVRA